MRQTQAKVQVIGFVGSVEARETKVGKVVDVRISTQENYTNAAGEKIERTNWHDFVAFKGMAGRAEKVLTPGAYVLLEGDLSYEEEDFTDKDGNKRKGLRARINLTDISTLENKADTEGRRQKKAERKAAEGA